MEVNDRGSAVSEAIPSFSEENGDLKSEQQED
jgi:hypothetical protein